MGNSRFRNAPSEYWLSLSPLPVLSELRHESWQAFWMLLPAFGLMMALPMGEGGGQVATLTANLHAWGRVVALVAMGRLVLALFIFQFSACIGSLQVLMQAFGNLLVVLLWGCALILVLLYGLLWAFSGVLAFVVTALILFVVVIVSTLMQDLFFDVDILRQLERMTFPFSEMGVLNSVGVGAALGLYAAILISQFV
jgi:hypothetical protein